MQRVSIVIRNYNCAQFLRDALDSALRQSYSALEIVVVDDGSTDRSRDILRAYSGKCRIVVQDNGGEGSAINAGFAAATGDIIVFLDADDVLAPDAVSAIVSAWSPDVARVHFPMWIMNKDGVLSDSLTPHFTVANCSLAEDLARFGQVVSGGQSFNAYAAWALHRILPLDPVTWRRAPDCYLNALTASQSRSVQIRRPLGCYRIHPGNLTLLNSLDNEFRRDIVLLHPRLYEAIRVFVGEERWRTLAPKAPTYHWLHRILNYLVSHEAHPFPTDRLGFLVRKCVGGIVTRPETAPLRRVLLLGGLFALIALPKRLRIRFLPTLLRISRATNRSTNISSALLFGRKRRGVHWREFYTTEKHRGDAPMVSLPCAVPD